MKGSVPANERRVYGCMAIKYFTSKTSLCSTMLQLNILIANILWIFKILILNQEGSMTISHSFKLLPVLEEKRIFSYNYNNNELDIWNNSRYVLPSGF